MPTTGFVFWIPIAFVLIVVASFVGTILALQVYHGDRTVNLSFSDFIKRFSNDRR